MSSIIIAEAGVLDLNISISAHHFKKRTSCTCSTRAFYKVCLRAVALLKMGSARGAEVLADSPHYLIVISISFLWSRLFILLHTLDCP